MSGLNTKGTMGILRSGWSTEVGDYAIAGGWIEGGKALVVGDAAGGLYAFGGDSGETIWKQEGVHEGGMLACSIHPDGVVLATTGQDGRVLIWDATKGQIEKAIELGDGWVENVAWSPDGAWLAVSMSRKVYVFDADGSEVWCSDEHPSTISALAWSTSELATACYGQVSFFGAFSGKIQQRFEWKGSLVSMVLSPDGDVVACGSQDRSVHFWRRSTGEDSMMTGYPSKPSALAFDTRGLLLATGGGELVTMWSFKGNGPEGTRPHALSLHTLPVTTLSFAPNSMLLASGARDGSVAVWSLQSSGEGIPVGASVTTDAVSGLYWRPGNGALAGLDAQGGVTTWFVGP
ncbi:MAG: hypothetical protein CL920_38825 [Deltaproteobacteria bacterium]|nr:hypothetical protein [Deltaproteobacteria bacterium]|tara:strand:- start:1176 stop:2216 length:1041 start_codon:yes stop_codon:yes gene_type:complete